MRVNYQQLIATMKLYGSYRGRPSLNDPQDWHWYLTVGFPNGFGVFLTYYFNKDWLKAAFYENKDNKAGHKLLAKPGFAGREKDVETLFQQIEKVSTLPDSRYKDYAIVITGGTPEDGGTFTMPPVRYHRSLAEFRELLAAQVTTPEA